MMTRSAHPEEEATGGGIAEATDSAASKRVGRKSAAGASSPAACKNFRRGKVRQALMWFTMETFVLRPVSKATCKA